MLKLVIDYFKRVLKQDKEGLALVLIFLITVPFLLTPWIYTDGVGEYAWVRSIVIDGDLDCSNEYEHYTQKFQKQYGWVGTGYDLCPIKSKTGVQINKYPIGSALLWGPFFIIGHIITVLFTSLPADGYSKIYVMMVSFGSCFYAFLGILLGYYISRRFFPQRLVFFAAIGIWFATSIPVYMYLNPSMPHNTSLFVVTLFLFYWLKTIDKRNLIQWAILGALGGLMTLVRMENIVFLIAPFLESMINLIHYVKSKDKQKIQGLIFRNILLFIFAIIVFFPQLYVWKVVFGQFFIQPYEIAERMAQNTLNSAGHDTNMSGGSSLFSFLHFLTHPHLGETLWGSSYGIFIWTPIIFFCVLGLIYFFKKDKRIAFIILMAFLAIIYVTSNAQKGGASFGDRYLIRCTSIYIIGLSGIFYFLKNKIGNLVFIIITCVFIIWNGLLIVQYSTGLVNRAGPVNWSKTIKNQFTESPKKLLLMAKPFLFERNKVYETKKQNEERKNENIK